MDLAERGLVTVVVGLALVVLGAAGATVLTRRPPGGTRMPVLLLQLVPFGMLVGAGAAMVRGWEPLVSMLAGAVTVPLVAAAGRWVEIRRSRQGRP